MQPETAMAKKFLDTVRECIRIKHYSYSTEKSYLYWIKQFILYHNKRHPKEKERKTGLLYCRIHLKMHLRSTWKRSRNTMNRNF